MRDTCHEFDDVRSYDRQSNDIESNDTRSNYMQQQDPNAEYVVKAMESAKALSDVVAASSGAVASMAEKRVTLEEKMLRKYLHQMSCGASTIISRLHTITSDGATINEDVLNRLSKLCDDMNGALFELQKAIDHSLNYLEQYFEHDFNIRLNAEFRFVEQLDAICTELEGSNKR